MGRCNVYDQPVRRTLDDNDWHCFTLSEYHRETGEWEMEKAPLYHIVD